jgi:hypothetical protein
MVQDGRCYGIAAKYFEAGVKKVIVAAPVKSGAGNPTDVTLHQGGISIDGDFVTSLSKDAVGKPIDIVPNIYYGVSDTLSVGGVAEKDLAQLERWLEKAIVATLIGEVINDPG